MKNIMRITGILFFMVFLSEPVCNQVADEFQVTTHEAHQTSPDIFRDYVVYVDYRNRNADIYAFNLAYQEEKPICVNPHDQTHPKIFGDTVIW
ncbi:MAG: hypothetical protein HXS47_03145, partial [Theionarchaea archaeon]|nr:hypothetical protein [Theionarchaea archaeon]